MSILRKIFITLLIVFFCLQFIRPARNNGQAESVTDVTHIVQTPDTILSILKISCYDCHSNHTNYPWYVNINPVGLWLRNHIIDGKDAINFSDLTVLTKKILDERFGDIAEDVEKGEMPLSSYTLIHGYAKLESGQISLIKSWVAESRKQIGYQH